MPSGPQELRDIFMTEDDDGIGKAEKIIRDAGYKINRGVIMIPATIKSKEVNQAIDYLIEEWDYACEEVKA
jgi:hypothetical protein